MLITDLFDGVSSTEIYHWTDADGLRKILGDDCIDLGASTHHIGDKTLYGVSCSRNPYFDIQQTYAIAGRKAWRIGLDYRKLRTRFRVIPIRDERYRHIPKTKIFHHPMRGEEMSDESEEFVLGAITPLSRFITSLAVEDQHVDPTMHPLDSDQSDYDPHSGDQVLLFDILASEHPEMLNAHRERGDRVQWNHINLPDVPLMCIQRDVPRVIPFRQAWSSL